MNSRQRLIDSLNHKEPDRIPIDLNATQMTGIMAVAYRNLRKHLGLNIDSIKVYETMQQLALVDMDVIARFGIDVVGVNPESIKGWKRDKMTDGSEALYPDTYDYEVLENGKKVIRNLIGYFGYNYNLHPTMIMPKGCNYFEFAYHPLENAESEQDIDNFKWFWEIPDSDLKYFKDKIEGLSHDTSFGILANTIWGGWGQHYEVLQNLRGWDKFIMDFVTNKKLARYMLEKRFENVLKRWDILLEAVGNRVQVVTMGDDMGMQDGPQMSPELYREMLKPIHKKFLSFIKQRTSAKVWMHNCGSIYQFIPDYIDVGIDIISPVQITARDMDPIRLKKEFGRDITFWGAACDSQKILPFGKPKDVREEVKRMIDALAPGGGFVFAPIMNIQLDVPPENIVTMFDTVLECGKY